VAVNYAPNQSHAYLRLPFADLAGHHWLLNELLGGTSYEREGDDLNSRGLYVDLEPWQYHVFELKTPVASAVPPRRRSGGKAIPDRHASLVAE